MTSGQKIAFSFLTSLAIFAVFVLCTFTSLIPSFEAKFYTQLQIRAKTEKLDKIAESVDLYISKILDVVENNEDAYLKDPCVGSYFLQNPPENHTIQRRRLTENLFNEFNALTGIRIIDKNAKSVHFSTFDSTDILSQSGITKIYKNYPDIQKENKELDFDKIAVQEINPKTKILLDSQNNRLLISFPYYWYEGIFTGTLVCYFDLYTIQQDLVQKQILSYGEKIYAVVSPDSLKGGIITGIPGEDYVIFSNAILDFWQSNRASSKFPEQLLSIKDGGYWLILSSFDSKYLKVCGVYDSYIFEISDGTKIIIYLALYLSLFLIAFLIFSLQKDSISSVKNRLKKIQFELIREYLNNREHIEWSSVSKQLKARKNELNDEIIKSLNVSKEKESKLVDEFLENSWEEIFCVLDGKNVSRGDGISNLSGSALNEIKQLLEDLLEKKNFGNLNKSGETKLVKSINNPKRTDVEKVSDAEDLEDLDDVEEVSDAEDLEDLDDVEEVSDAEDVENLDDVEEVSDAEDLENSDDVEEVSDAEDVENLDDVEEVSDAEDVEDLDDVEEVFDAEDVEDLDDVEEVSDAEDLEDLEILPADEEFQDYLSEVNSKSDQKTGVNPAVYEYIECNESFIYSENFATVENFFAEQLSLGGEYVIKRTRNPYVPFTLYNLDDGKKFHSMVLTQVEDDGELQSLEELTEEVQMPDSNSYYSFTKFAEYAQDLLPLEDSDNMEKKTIIETDGVFAISENLDFAGLEQNLDFKSLVDSVLRK